MKHIDQAAGTSKFFTALRTGVQRKFMHRIPHEVDQTEVLKQLFKMEVQYYLAI